VQAETRIWRRKSAAQKIAESSKGKTFMLLRQAVPRTYGSVRPARHSDIITGWRFSPSTASHVTATSRSSRRSRAALRRSASGVRVGVTINVRTHPEDEAERQAARSVLAERTKPVSPRRRRGNSSKKAPARRKKAKKPRTPKLIAKHIQVETPADTAGVCFPPRLWLGS